MNDRHDNQQTPESLDAQIERIETRKLRAETQLIEAGTRHDRHRLVLDIVKRARCAAIPAIRSAHRCMTGRRFSSRSSRA